MMLQFGGVSRPRLFALVLQVVSRYHLGPQRIPILHHRLQKCRSAHLSERTIRLITSKLRSRVPSCPAALETVS
jgi:hypothetical protein